MPQGDAIWPLGVVNTLIAIEQRGEPCWRVGRTFGSMAAVDFGRRVAHQTRRGSSVEVGSSSLAIRDCFWRFIAVPFSTDSEAFDAEMAIVLSKFLAGAVLAGVERDDRWLRFAFSNDARWELDLTNQYEAPEDESIAELRLSGGTILEVGVSGKISADQDGSLARQQRYA